jgi:hypothetical protein
MLNREHYSVFSMYVKIKYDIKYHENDFNHRLIQLFIYFFLYDSLLLVSLHEENILSPLLSHVLKKP